MVVLLDIKWTKKMIRYEFRSSTSDQPKWIMVPLTRRGKIEEKLFGMWKKYDSFRHY